MYTFFVVKTLRHVSLYRNWF